MKKSRMQLRRLRSLSQILCFVLFLFLFIKTDYAGSDEIPYAVNLLFRLDPLLAICASLASRSLASLMFPSLFVVGLTIILGRFFCGWICPMGAMLDFIHRLTPYPRSEKSMVFRPVKYYLFIFLLAGAFSGLSLAGYFDPFSILVRALALCVYPALNVAATSFFSFTYQQAPQWINALTEPVYSALKNTILPVRQNVFDLALLSFFILLSVFLLERLERRFFCRNFCPLGALLSIVSRYSMLKGQGGSGCAKCRNCMTICRMDAIDENRHVSAAACILCMDCIDLCPEDRISFSFGRAQAPQSGRGLSRRAFLGTLAAGALTPFIFQTRALAKSPDPYLIRPPGALTEPEFLSKCVRCGECMKVCIGNALQPTFIAAGLEGMFTPRLRPRVGYCEYNCTLCGQVCPTGAIQELSLAEKQTRIIGCASFDKNRCLPYAKGISCIVCEEHCPTPQKAIQFRETSVLNYRGETVIVKQPYVVDDRCIGCGICEAKCPLFGESAVRVRSEIRI